MPNVNFEKVVRELWTQRRLKNETYKESPFYALINKKEDFHEKIRHVNVKYGNSHNRNTSFTDAQSLGARDPQFGGFAIVIKEQHAVGTLDGLTLEQTESDKAAQVNYINDKTSGTLQEMMNALCHQIVRDGSGTRGQVASVSGATITLNNDTDVYNFENDQRVVVGTTVAGALRAGSEYIADIDPDANTITLDAAITGMAANDYVFIWGDAQNAGSATKVVSGVGGWNPLVAPTSGDDWFGQDRSVHTNRLAGVRHVGTGDASVKEAVLKLLTKMKLASNKNIKSRNIFMNDIDYESLLIDVQGQRDYMQVDVKGADVYFEALNFSTPYGRMAVHPCKYFEQGIARVIDCDSLTLHSLKAPVRISKYDGLSTLRQADADGIEFRALSRCELATDEPLNHGVVSLPS